LFGALAAYDVRVLDVEQVVIRGRLVLCALVSAPADEAGLRRAVGELAGAQSTSRPRMTTCSTSSTRTSYAASAPNNRVVTPGRSFPVRVTSTVEGSGGAVGGSSSVMVRITVRRRTHPADPVP
jgi:phosphoserine phosphatase